MAVSQAHLLTEHFYAWEKRGRGWTVSDTPVELEPTFVPFWAHGMPATYIDDGKRPTFLSKIATLFVPEHTVTMSELPPEDGIGYPDTDTEELVVYAIAITKEAVRPETMEQFLVMLSYLKSPVSFELIATATEITVQCTCRESSAPFMYRQLRIYFPGYAVIETTDDKVLEIFEQELPVYTVDFGLADEFMRPIATLGTGHHDPYTPLFGIIEGLVHEDSVIVQILFSGTHNAWSESIVQSVSDGGKGSFFIDAPEMPNLAKEKVSCPLYGVSVRIVTCSDTLENASRLLQQVAVTLVHASTSAFNKLVPLSDYEHTVQQRLTDILLRQSHRVGMLLNSRELCTLVHFPNSQLSKKLHGRNGTTKAAPETLVNEPYCLGINSHQGVKTAIGIDTAQRVRHMHIIGSTGVGKSTLLHSLVMQDVNNGTGCCVIDPHGDLVESVLHAIPEHRIPDVVLIDPTDGEYPVAFNILSAHSDLERELLASDMVALFRRFSTSWGDQMNSVFANAISAFVYNSKAGHLGDLRKFLIETEFRHRILLTCTDPEIVYYWQKEYPILKSSSIGSILTRLDSFLRPRSIRNMVCQKESLNVRELMDTNKIVLVKLSQGLLGEENSYLLGALMVSKLQQTAMARQVQESRDRVPFFCYIDEFQHFVTPSMASILSGARKYALGLILAHQDMQQVSKVDNDIAGSLLSNAGTRICFRLGDTDAKRMQEGFSAFNHEDLQSLSTGEAIVRVNTKEQDFNITVTPYEHAGISYKDGIIAHTRQMYSVKSEPPPPASPEPPPAPAQPAPPPPVAPIPAYEPVADMAEKTEVREHRYLQMVIKKMAEQRGYKAAIEAPTPDGGGLVDVLLEKDGKHTAIEISVTTPAAWELHNIRKCLAAGYTTIVCTTTAAKRTAIQKRIATELSINEQAIVTVITKDAISNLFAPSEPAQKETVYKGYRVKVEYGQANSEVQENIIQRILQSGKK